MKDAAAEFFVQRWTQTRIDEPKDIMARQDDAARQLIAVSGLLQGLSCGLHLW